MKFHNEYFNRIRISTKGMKQFDIIKHQKILIKTGLFDEIKSTKFYRDEGQLQSCNDKPVCDAFYIQREDSQCFFVACWASAGFGLIKKHLNPNIKAEVILCKVPACYVSECEMNYLNSEYGVLEFLANHHPVHITRVEVIKVLLEMVDA